MISLWVAVFGACIGSFLNVVIHRIPRGESVVYPRSRCRCGQPIAWYDNIPVLSWFVLRGRCRHCKEKFSFRYPFVEALTAALFLGLYWSYSPFAAAAYAVFAALMLCAAFIDLDTMEIPDRFSIGGFLLGVLLSAVFPVIHGYSGDLLLADGLRGIISALTGAFVGSGLILWIALVSEKILRKEAMGFGDVKLMGAIGAFCGWQGAVFALFGGSIAGLLFAIPVLAGRRAKAPSKSTAVTEPATESGEIVGGDRDVDAEDTGQAFDMEGEDESIRIPFGPALVIGALIYLLWTRDWVYRYFAEISYVLF